MVVIKGMFVEMMPAIVMSPSDKSIMPSNRCHDQLVEAGIGKKQFTDVNVVQGVTETETSLSGESSRFADPIL